MAAQGQMEHQLEQLADLEQEHKVHAMLGL